LVVGRSPSYNLTWTGVCSN